MKDDPIYLNADLSNNKLLNDALPLLAVILREYPHAIRSLDLTHNNFAENQFANVLVAVTEHNYSVEVFRVDGKYAAVERTLTSLTALNRDLRLVRKRNFVHLSSVLHILLFYFQFSYLLVLLVQKRSRYATPI